MPPEMELIKYLEYLERDYGEFSQNLSTSISIIS